MTDAKNTPPQTRALGGDDLDPKALKEAKIAYDQKYADMSGPYPTEEPDAGDGPLGYAIRAYLKSLVPAIPLSLTQSREMGS